MASPRFRDCSAVRPSRRRAASSIARSVALAACLIAGLATTSARGQAVPFDVTAPTIASTAPIAAYIDGAVAEMASGDRERVMAARETLLRPLAGAAQAKSQAFLAAYAVELNRRLMPVASGKDPHAKLNAAIVVLRAAEQGRSPALSPIIATLIGDPSSAIVTFGLRAAGEVIVPALANAASAQNDVLVPAIVKAVSTNPETPAVIFEAYQALTVVVLNRVSAEAVGAPAIATATPRLVDAIQQLLDVRLKQYAAGDIVEPAAEQAGLSFLARRQTWEACSPAQKAKSVGAMMGVAASAATALEQDQSSAAKSRARQVALRNAAKGAGQAMGVIAQIEGKTDLVTVANAMRGLGDATPAAEYRAAAAKMQAEATKAFPAAAAPAADAPTTTAPTGG